MTLLTTKKCWVAQTHALAQALLEKLENSKLQESEVVQLLKAKHLQTAQKGAGQSAVDVFNFQLRRMELHCCQDHRHEAAL